MDGAQSSRTFLHINSDSIVKENFTVPNPCSVNRNVVFMMDFSHVVKKVRNNILKSGLKTGCTRLLTLYTGRCSLTHIAGINRTAYQIIGN